MNFLLLKMDLHIKLSNAMYATSLELSGIAKTKAIEESVLQIMKSMTGAEKNPRTKEIFEFFYVQNHLWIGLKTL